VDGPWSCGLSVTVVSPLRPEPGSSSKAGILSCAKPPSKAHSFVHTWYDQLNQLTAFSRGVLSASGSTLDTIASPSHSQSWGLDAMGNWTSFTSDSTTQTRTHNSQDEITSISGSVSNPTFDHNGNMTGDQQAGRLVYDAWNRLVSYQIMGVGLETYQYDALNRRVIENSGVQRVLYYSSSWQVLEEDVAGTMQDQYVWSPVYVDAMIERDRPTERLYVQQDANWDVTAVISTTGAVQERYIQDPYGGPSVLDPNWNTRASSLFAWNYLHQGGRYDSLSGLYLIRQRDYSATLGRWAQVDPIGYAGADSNLYRYVNSNPVTMTDPSGLAVESSFGRVFLNLVLGPCFKLEATFQLHLDFAPDPTDTTRCQLAIAAGLGLGGLFGKIQQDFFNRWNFFRNACKPGCECEFPKPPNVITQPFSFKNVPITITAALAASSGIPTGVVGCRILVSGKGNLTVKTWIGDCEK
jgi:RHS repeat-associated protein